MTFFNSLNPRRLQKYNNPMKTDPVLGLLEKFNQNHIVNHLQRLTPPQRQALLTNIQSLDLPLVFEIYRTHSQGNKPGKAISNIEPAPIIAIPQTREEEENREKARGVGEALIRENKVAVLIVAGGQGSRLGFEGPKGKYPLSPLRQKSLFQLFAESVRALSLRYKTDLPLIIMTSRENDEETRAFFKSRQWFGLKPDQVEFFSQGMLPTLTPEGRLILSDETHLLINPDGHGGSLKALHESGILKKLRGKGYAELFYCQVDNPIVRIADPVFLGYHKLANAEISTKVVRRQNLEEKVGIYGLANGRPGIIEYSDFSPEDYRAVDENGKIRFWAGNTAVHCISLAFIERLNRHGFALPYHRAAKDVEALGGDGKRAKAQGWKFETFVFDAIPLAERAICMEVVREEEFSPVKNFDGIDSPGTAQRAMIALHCRWLNEAGIRVAPGARVEISPLFALDPEELRARVRGKGLKIEKDLCLDEGFEF